jgi:hypothetical protein
MVTLLIAGSVVVFGSIFIASINHHHKQKSFLENELTVDDEIDSEFKNKFGALEGAVIGVSVFDVLYNIGRVDPFVLSGINHLHHSQNFGSLGELSTYLKESIVNSEAGTGEWRQMIHKYKGYTGEESTFEGIRESGHSIEIPESGTFPQIDAIIDGQKFNMAVTDNPSYIQHKLDTLPEDVHIWTNKEMADAFSDNPRVHIDPTLSSQDAFQMTNETFEGVAELGDFIDDIPIFTLAISGVKNINAARKGNKSVGDAIEHTVLDTAGVGFGGYVGSKTGLALGLAMAPMTGGTSAIIIPIATTIIGTIIGIITGKGITNQFKERHLRSAIESLNQESGGFAKLFLENFNNLLIKVSEMSQIQVDKLKFSLKNCDNWVKRIFFPSVMSKFYKMAQNRSKNEHSQTISFYHGLLETIKGKPLEESGLIIYSQRKSVLLGNLELVESWDNVDNKIKIVEKEKKRVS